MSWQSVKQIVNDRLNIKLTSRQQFLALGLILIGLVAGFSAIVEEITWSPFLLLLFLLFESVCAFVAFKTDEYKPNKIFKIKMCAGAIIATIAFAFALYKNYSIWMSFQIFLIVILAVFFAIVMGN